MMNKNCLSLFSLGKLVLISITNENQFGFMKNCHIFNDIRLVFVLIDFPDLIVDDSLIFFFFFPKAFDTWASFHFSFYVSV